MSQRILYNNGQLRNVHIFKLKPLKEDGISRNQENLLLIFWGPKLSRLRKSILGFTFNFCPWFGLVWLRLSGYDPTIPTIQNECALSWRQELQETAHFL